jgi:protein-disulfide isomerase
MSHSTFVRLSLPVSERDHVQGLANAPVTLVEYGDYECPYTGRAYPIVKEIQQILGGQVRFVFRNFPLEEIHPHAEGAAEAAEAAGAQKMFWEMHDRLFEHQRALDVAHLTEYARQLGLDQARFESDLAEHRHEARVREDILSGVHSGVQGTPTFYINGRRHEGSYDADTLLRAIRGAEGRSDGE